MSTAFAVANQYTDMINYNRLSEYPILSVDVETTGLHWYKDKLFGIAIAAYDGENVHADYFDIRTPSGRRKREILRSELPKAQGRIVNHGIKFDAHFLANEGIILPDNKIECTGVRAAVINEHEKSHSLDYLCQQYLKVGKVDVYQELADLFGGKPTREVQIKNLHRAPESLAKKYAIKDPELAIRLWLWQEQEISKQGLSQIWDLERRLTPVLIGMERHGVRVDTERAQFSIYQIEEELVEAQKTLDAVAGRPVNANSSPQIKGLFGAHKRVADNPKGYQWFSDNGFLLPFTETDNASIGKDELVLMADRGDPRAKAVLKLRKLTKAKSFLKDHILGHELDGRVYPNYNQMRGENELGTRTGRLSVNDPALQQIPSRDEDIASIVRACFIPDEESHTWCCDDWEQFEFRWFAHYTKDPNILKAYEDDPDTDYHQIVSDLTGIPRKPRFAGDANSKQINLGLVFGMGKGKMAYEMGLDYVVRYGDDGREWFNAGPKAEEVFNAYHRAIPGVASLLSQASSIAKSRGYVQTIGGRHIRFPGGKFTHKAGGLVFQGSSADCMKQKMVELWPISKKMGFNMILSVHDELDFSMPKSEAKAMSELVKKNLETFDGVKCPIKCRVPIRSSVGLGDNWYEASK